jgi:alkaline phosphatase D
VSPDRTIVFLLLLLLLLPCLIGCNAADTVADAIGDGDNDAPFPFGVASGDVTASRAVLWTRTRQAAPLTLEVSTSATFTSPPAVRQTVSTTDVADFTVKVVVEGLTPATGYFYRWQQGTAASATGTFRTAPAAEVAQNVRFAYTGDADGTQVVPHHPVFNAFETLNAVRSERPDFFVYLGDTVYADSLLRVSGPAVTLGDYRETYRQNLDIAALPALLQSTAVYAIWDDHEVRNDFAGATVDRTLYGHGRQAFLEYQPIAEDRLPVDPSCAGAPLFRVFRWGTAVEVIILDERSCRSASVEALCGGDLVPTLPPARRRQLRGALGVPTEPPAGCLTALADPARTLLGPVQKALFKEVLRTSDATFKFVINEVPIQQSWILPYDRWEGYAAERAEILHFLRDNNIQHVIFLTTDTHASVINEVFVDRFTEPAPLGHEFITGPIATTTLAQEILVRFGPFTEDDVHELLTLAGVACREFDQFSYGVVEVDAAAGSATILLKDATGTVLHDQLNAAVLCQKTLGP